MYYSQKKKFLFAHVSRTGGVSISNFLYKNVADVKEIIGQHISLRAAQAVLKDDFDDLFKFAIVRNPFERFVSWYALMGQIPNFDLEADQLQNSDTEHWRGFDSFLEKWSTEKVIINGEKYPSMSQFAQLADINGKLLTNEIARFENYNEDVPRILKKIGLEFPVHQKKNASKHLHYSAYYSNFGRDLIQDLYEKDLVEFGYQFESLETHF